MSLNTQALIRVPGVRAARAWGPQHVFADARGSAAELLAAIAQDELVRATCTQA